MSNLANKLYNDIQNEYEERLKDKTIKGDKNVFNKDIFINKYHYSNSTLSRLLDELESFGYIEKWVIGAFKLKID